MQLTEARAKVLQELLEAAGLAASRIQARGMGVTNPPVTKGTASDKGLNRSTQITLTLVSGTTALKQ